MVLVDSSARPVNASHARTCAVCKLRERAELEAGYTSWVPIADLAQLYGVSEPAIRQHALAAGLDLVRLSRIALAYGRIVEAGLQAAQVSASPADALHALRQLEDLAPGQPQPGPQAGQAVTTWEQSVRVTRQEPAGSDGRPPVVSEGKQIPLDVDAVRVIDEEESRPAQPAGDELAYHADTDAPS